MKQNNNNNFNDKPIEAEEIIGRLKEALRVTADGQLANYLGISRQNIGAARKRRDIPPGWIYKVAALTGCSMDWLRFGQGAKIRREYTAAKPHPQGQISSPQSSFQGGRKPGTVGKGSQDEDIIGFGEAVEMLAKIYNSKDEILIRTINANIRAFCESIDRKQRERHSAKELENLKKRLTQTEKKR